MRAASVPHPGRYAARPARGVLYKQINAHQRDVPRERGEHSAKDLHDSATGAASRGPKAVVGQRGRPQRAARRRGGRSHFFRKKVGKAVGDTRT